MATTQTTAKKKTPSSIAKTPAIAKAAAKKPAAAKAAASKKTVAAEPKKAAPKKTAAKSATPAKIHVSPEQRYCMIAEAAYYHAERRGFQGDPVKDWVAAEKEIEVLLSKK
ncbi:MAG: DUF2934 domain-containing protein [Betaproteobacteria bacterium]